MKNALTTLLQKATQTLIEQNVLPEGEYPEPIITIPKEKQFGDYATNIAMIQAKIAKIPPRDLAAKYIEAIGNGGGLVSKAETAGPGFINFFLDEGGLFDILARIEAEGDRYGMVDLGQGQKLQVEFVSANPTGPLHVGHGRGAVFGDTLARILSAAGYDVSKEYYVNDAGVQINTLGKSTFLRYRQLLGDEIAIPQGHYVGDYLIETAQKLRDKHGDTLTEADVPMIAEFAAADILQSIKDDLGTIGVIYNNWFSERTLHDGTLDAVLADLKERDLAYEQDGALWFRTEKFGDDKDRVLIKSDGHKTYFAADVAYHANKYQRGFDRVINVWGADHHGYIPRMKAAVQAVGRKPEDLDVLLIQLVSLTRGGQVQQMSTRSGTFITMKELADEVGSDALRYFYLMRRHDAQLEFDIDLALERSNQNPVFYVQYMHARICSVFAKAKEAGFEPPSFAEIDIAKLGLQEEKELVRHLAEFPVMISDSAKFLEAHRLIGYLFELANKFHYYYHHHRVLSDDPEMTRARLVLYTACRQVLCNGLAIAGISAPETM